MHYRFSCEVTEESWRPLPCGYIWYRPSEIIHIIKEKEHLQRDYLTIVEPVLSPKDMLHRDAYIVIKRSPRMNPLPPLTAETNPTFLRPRRR